MNVITVGLSLLNIKYCFKFAAPYNNIWIKYYCSTIVVAESTQKAEKEHSFAPGDNIEVCEGELINLQGRVISVKGNKITMMPKHEDLNVSIFYIANFSPPCLCYSCMNKCHIQPWHLK